MDIGTGTAQFLSFGADSWSGVAGIAGGFKNGYSDWTIVKNDLAVTTGSGNTTTVNVITSASISANGGGAIDFAYNGFETYGSGTIVATFTEAGTVKAIHTVTHLAPDDNDGFEGYSYSVSETGKPTKTSRFLSYLTGGSGGEWILERFDDTRQRGKYNWEGWAPGELPAAVAATLPGNDFEVTRTRYVHVIEEKKDDSGAWQVATEKHWAYEEVEFTDEIGFPIAIKEYLTLVRETIPRVDASGNAIAPEVRDTRYDYGWLTGELRSITNPDGSWTYFECDQEGDVEAIWSPWKETAFDPNGPLPAAADCRIARQIYLANGDPVEDATTETLGGVTVTSVRHTPASKMNRVSTAGIVTRYNTRRLWTDNTGALGAWQGTVGYPAGLAFITVLVDGSGKVQRTNAQANSTSFATDYIDVAAFDLDTGAGMAVLATGPYTTTRTTEWSVDGFGDNQIDTYQTKLTADGSTVSTKVITRSLDGFHSSTTVDGATTDEYHLSKEADGTKTETKTDEAGVVTTTVTSADGKIVTRTKTGVATGADWEAQADLVERTVTSTFEETTDRRKADGSWRLLSRTVKDGLGRPLVVTDEIGRETSYSYSVADDGGEVVTETRPGGVAVETRNWRDGQLRSVITRDAANAIAAAEYHDYAVNNGSSADYAYGSITETIHYGSENGAHWKKITRNALGWVLREEEPGPTQSGGNPVPIVRAYTHDARGLVTKVSATGLADHLYVYDDMQRLTREGYDLDGNGTLDLDTRDTVTETVYAVYPDWESVTSKKYNQDGVAGSFEQIQQLTKLGGGPNRSTKTIYQDGTQRLEETTVNIASKTETSTVKITAPNGGTATTISSQKHVNGLLVKAREPGFVGDTYYRYDTEGRLWKAIHPGYGTSEVTFDGETGQIATENRPGQTTVTYSYFSNDHPSAGQVAAAIQTDAGVIRYAYDVLGRLTHQWGSGSQPLQYSYDSAHGGLTALRTYQGDDIPNTGPEPPDEFGTATAAVTQWVYHPGTAKLWKKVDAEEAFTEYLYLDSGLLKTRRWARPTTPGGATKLAAEYEYENMGGESGSRRIPSRLTSITYNDDGVTPNVTHTYTRDGRRATTSDKAGLHSWSYSPWSSEGMTATETIAACSSGRLWEGAMFAHKSRWDSQATQVIQSGGAWAQSVIRDFGSTGSYVGSRVRFGFSGTFASNDYDVSHQGRRVPAASGTITSLTSVRNRGGFSTYWTFDAQGRLTDTYSFSRMNTTSAGIPDVSRPLGWTYEDFDGVGRRKTVLPYKQPSASYAANHPPAWSYDYNDRGEVASASRFRPESGAGAVIGSQNRGYEYDGIGNRTSATVGASPVRTTSYPDANALNQYEGITNSRSLEISGTMAAGFTPTVKVDGEAVALDGIGTGEPGSFRAEKVVVGDALWAALEISATDPATGDPVVLASGHRYVPPAAETLDYDEDGNLIEDGRWKYTWDAENRLIGMEEKARAVGGGVDPASLPSRKRLTFAYDARHRRIAKWVHEWDDASSSFSKLVKDTRFLYDGWNMTVELDHTFATGDGLAGSRPVREFFWGPDLSGTMDGAGGVGGLVSMKWQGSHYLPCIDGNGNIKGWLKLLGNNKYELTARYDYDPFGNRITDTGPGIEVSPFGFSTKYRDEETGLLDYGYRFYDPVRGRWLSRDPLGDDAFFVLHTQDKTRTERAQLRAEALKPPYVFVSNDPANEFDYLGLHCGITVHRAPVKVRLGWEWPPLVIDVGHEWIEFDGQGYGYWPEGRSVFYSDGKIYAGDDPYTGKRNGTNWDVACNKTSGGRFGDSHTTVSAAPGKGKKCDCASCDDIKNCLKAVALEWSSGTSYCLPWQTCREFVATALLRCGLHRTAQAK